MKEDLIKIVGNLDKDDIRLLYVVALELNKKDGDTK